MSLTLDLKSPFGDWWILECVEFTDFFMTWPDRLELIADIPEAFTLWYEEAHGIKISKNDLKLNIRYDS